MAIHYRGRCSERRTSVLTFLGCTYRSRGAGTGCLTLMQPLAGPVARVAVGWVLRGQIRGALEAAADFGGRLRSRVQQKALWGQEQEGDRDSATPSAEDWWNALLEEVGVSNAAGDGAEDDDNDNDNDSDLCSEEDADETETEPLVETRTRATVQGIVRTTVTQASPSAEPEESVLAVGIGAQVLPGRGGPYGASAPEVLEDGTEGVKVRATEEAREAVGDVAGAEEYAEEVVREGVRRAVMVREDVEGARGRGEVRERVERRRKGWRSAVFDF